MFPELESLVSNSEALQYGRNRLNQNPFHFDQADPLVPRPRWLEKAIKEKTIVADFWEQDEDYWCLRVKTPLGLQTADPGDLLVRMGDGSLAVVYGGPEDEATGDSEGAKPTTPAGIMAEPCVLTKDEIGLLPDMLFDELVPESDDYEDILCGGDGKVRTSINGTDRPGPDAEYGATVVVLDLTHVVSASGLVLNGGARCTEVFMQGGHAHLIYLSIERFAALRAAARRENQQKLSRFLRGE